VLVAGCGGGGGSSDNSQEFNLAQRPRNLSCVAGEQPIPEKAVAITIDDGFSSAYQVVWPILKKYQVKATLFLYTDVIGAPVALNWPQVQEMTASGLIDVQSHGKSHASLSRGPNDKSNRAYRARIRKEMRGADAAFQKHLGQLPAYFAYPYGDSSDVAIAIAREEGVMLAATVSRGGNTAFSDPYLLRRDMIYASHDIAQFAEIVNSFSKKPLK
jgi:peptidoglycan/xylan/chitin deacetylase (PgdA/CDA1 family)